MHARSGILGERKTLKNLLIHETQEYGKTRAPAHSGCREHKAQQFLPAGAPTLTLPRLAAPAALEGEEVGVVAVAAQAEVGPPDGIALVRVQDELRLRQLHNPRSQLVTFIVHVRYLQSPQSSRQETRCIGIKKTHSRRHCNSHGFPLR